MKNFVKAVHKNGKTFSVFERKISKELVNVRKLKEGIFINPKIREVMQDKKFDDVLEDSQKAACVGFKAMCANFVGNVRAENYQEIINNMLRG